MRGGSQADKLDCQILVIAGLFGLMGLEPIEQHLDPVDSRENERDGIAGDRCAIAEIAHQGFGRMGEGFEPRQAEEPAGPFDGVDETKYIVENLGIVRVVLETNELDAHNVDAFIRLGQEIPQQLIHGKRFQRRAGALSCPRIFGNDLTVLLKGLILVAAHGPAALINLPGK
jgi:hypothetical protein